MNVDYKIGAKAIATRIKGVLDHIIHPDQNAFIPGRNITEAIRTVFDIMHYTNSYHMSGYAISIDFHKAFDSLSHDFLFKALRAYSFGPSIRKWIAVRLL